MFVSRNRKQTPFKDGLSVCEERSIENHFKDITQKAWKFFDNVTGIL